MPEDASVVPPHLPATIAGVQQAGELVSAAATALEEARKKIAMMKVAMEELRSGNLTMHQELLDYQQQKRQDGLCTLQTGGKGKKTITNPKPMSVPKRKAITGGGKGSRKAASASKRNPKRRMSWVW